ncbi:hypothetical protein SAMN05444266_104424 [Chitinophaga jiangningensis]|uniref:Uncharacterized protein n=1 Tax=Chitinophaga jiangningensis TaxID=1419482 RepID=A0A1M7CQ22_9BACT|nr:hypothetical protein [Chitinophaga jiangningensis]SHL69240.1 hypothetical protein SAMN05444266_104424 [Chitinophaga jiangningensis]
MKKFLFLFLVVALAASCGKDSYGPVPILSFEGYSVPSIDSNTTTFEAIFRVKDGDGDIDSSIFYTIHYYIPSTLEEQANARMPNIGQNTGKSVNAQVKVTLEAIDFVRWVEHTGTRPDSLWMEVFVQDRAGHISDTIQTTKIPIYKRQ